MSITLDRRSLLSGGLFGAGLFAAPGRLLAAGQGFTHSVASGDPVQTEVTLWTRYVSPDPARLRVEVADDPRFTRIAGRGEAVASPGADHCAKVRVTGLKPGRRYHYRFVAPGGERSEVGRTRTLPEGRLDRYRIAVVNCANATSG